MSLMNGQQARAQPVKTLLSGPAGGVVGAAAVARAAGVDDVITMDMGGPASTWQWSKAGK